MRVIIARVAAVIAGAIITFATGTLGLEVTEGAGTFLVEGITAIGMFVWLLAYALIHKAINSRINPTDAARP